jgi:energy-converting hydrogenase Eha subunit A
VKDTTIIVVTIIVCITVLEIVNLIFYKVDGAILSSIVGSLSALASHLITKEYVRTRERKTG